MSLVKCVKQEGYLCYSREYINDRVGERKLTPLYYAVESGRTDNIGILLELGASAFTAQFYVGVVFRS